MGCYVNFASAETRPRSATLKITLVLQMLRAGIFALLAVYSSFLFLAIAILEVVIGYWLWTQRIEAFGVAIGFTLFHILFPLTLGVSELVYLAVFGIGIIELMSLTQMHQKGYYNFNFLVKFDPNESYQASGVQLFMFKLVVIAQIIKATLLITGAFIIYGYEISFGAQFWYGIPQIPMIIGLGIVELAAAGGFYLHRDWAFHTLLATAALSFFETMIAWSFPIVLLGVWVITLMMPCWVKWAFYEGLLNRFRSQSASLESPSQLPIK